MRSAPRCRTSPRRPGHGAVQHLLRLLLLLRRGLYSNCHNVNPNATAVGGIYGYSHTCGGYDGGQAEFVRVPFADVGPRMIPDWMDEEDAVLLTDALATGYFGAQLGDIPRVTPSSSSAPARSACSPPSRPG